MDFKDYPWPEAAWHTIPEHMHYGVYAYVMYGHPIGDFLYDLFSNDFMGAAGRADHRNLAALKEWALFLYNWFPSQARGSTEAVEAWMAGGGLKGQREKADADG